MSRSLFLLALACLLSTAVVCAEEPPAVDLGAAARAAGTVNGLCPVMKRPVVPAGGAAEYRGEKVGFCCPPCQAKFEADPVRYMDRMRLNPPKYAYTSHGPTREAMAAAAQGAKSANGLCPVEEKLVVPAAGLASYRRQQIGFASAAARVRFLEDPEPFMRAMRADPMAYGYDRPGPTHAQLRMAREAAGSVNGLCPVMGNLVKPNGGSLEYEGQKIGFCCPPCIAKFRADAAGYLAKMREEPAVYGYLPPK